MSDLIKRFNHYHDAETYIRENSEKIIYWVGDAQARNEIILKRNNVNRGDSDWDWLVIWKGVEIQ